MSGHARWRPLGVLAAAAWGLLGACTTGSGSGDGPHIDNLVPPSASVGQCVHILGERFLPAGVNALDAGGSDAGPADAALDGRVADAGMRLPDASIFLDAAVRDGGARDAGADGGPTVDAAPSDAAVDLCYSGAGAPQGAFVSFGATGAQVLRWDGDRIVVRVPALPVGATDIVVTVDGHPSNRIPFDVTP